MIINGDNQMLLVRKAGTAAFMQPGGKIDAGESPVGALLRELKEELDLSVSSDALDFVGRFAETAANEPGHRVEADIFRLHYDGPVSGQAEIEELLWYPGEHRDGIVLAPLTVNHVIPASGV